MAEEIEDTLPVEEPAALPEEDVSAVEEPAEAAPPKPSLPESLVRRMTRLGMQAERFADTPPAQLEELIEYAEDQKIRQLEERVKQPVLQPQVQAPAPEPDDFDLGEMDDGLGNKIKITERDLPPGVAAAIRKRDAKLKAIEQSVKQRDALEQQRQKAAFIEAIDDAFDEMGEPHLFGKGPMASLAPESNEAKRRLKLLGESTVRPDVDSTSAMKRKLKAARAEVIAMWGGKEEKQEKQEPAPTNGTRFTNEQLRRPTSLLKPTNRKPGQLPEGTVEAQRQAAAEWFEQNLKPE